MPHTACTTDRLPWKVLIVDDDAPTRQLIHAALADKRYRDRPLELLTAHGLADAKRLLEHRHGDIAVALIDMAMEEPCAGLALAEHIRHRLHNHTMRLLLHTDLARPGSLCQALAGDFNACLDSRHARDPGHLWLGVLTALRAWHELTGLHRTIHELRHRSVTDPLTGLNNPSTLRQALTRALSGGQRRQETLTVLFLDVDNFKAINDEQGHLRGDEVLRAVGTALRTNSRMEDGCYRYGGDEFLVILPNCSVAQVEANYLPRLMAAFAALGVSVSHGAADAGPRFYPSADELIRCADERMYQRKRALHHATQGLPQHAAA